jgi:phage shock protein E
LKEMWPWLLGVGVIVALLWLGSWAVGGRDSAEAHRLVEEGALLLDVRTPAEFASGHLEGATNVPVDQLEARAGALGPHDRPVVVYCRSGARSAAAAITLRRLGFDRIEDLGAMRNW